MTIVRLDTYGAGFDDVDLYSVINTGIVVAMAPDMTPLVILGGWELVRSIRRYYLTASDWTQMPDAPLSDNNKALWQAYRQALRDIPQVYADYRDVRFPTIPTEA